MSSSFFTHNSSKLPIADVNFLASYGLMLVLWRSGNWGLNVFVDDNVQSVVSHQLHLYLNGIVNFDIGEDFQYILWHHLRIPSLYLLHEPAEQVHLKWSLRQLRDQQRICALAQSLNAQFPQVAFFTTIFKNTIEHLHQLLTIPLHKRSIT
jgi:hypothetical protein